LPENTGIKQLDVVLQMKLVSEISFSSDALTVELVSTEENNSITSTKCVNVECVANSDSALEIVSIEGKDCCKPLQMSEDEPFINGNSCSESDNRRVLSRFSSCIEIIPLCIDVDEIITDDLTVSQSNETCSDGVCSNGISTRQTDLAVNGGDEVGTIFEDILGVIKPLDEQLVNLKAELLGEISTCLVNSRSGCMFSSTRNRSQDCAPISSSLSRRLSSAADINSLNNCPTKNSCLTNGIVNLCFPAGVGPEVARGRKHSNEV
jgi:hypothetical protein